MLDLDDMNKHQTQIPFSLSCELFTKETEMSTNSYKEINAMELRIVGLRFICGDIS